MIAIVEGNINGALGSGEQHPLADRIFAHGVDHFVVGNAVDDLLPGLAAIVRAIDVRAQIVEPEAVDGGVRGLGIEMRRVKLRNFAPRRQVRRRDVVPVLPPSRVM